MVTLLSSLFLASYFASVLAFSCVTHPIGYCLLLILNAFSISGYACLALGFTWYVALFCLVYVGGVYVLFVFVSFHNPNSMPVSKSAQRVVIYTFWASFFFFLSVSYSYSGFKSDYSHNICTGMEGPSYLFLCVVLILGFMMISAIVSEKDSFFR